MYRLALHASGEYEAGEPVELSRLRRQSLRSPVMAEPSVPVPRRRTLLACVCAAGVAVLAGCARHSSAAGGTAATGPAPDGSPAAAPAATTAPAGSGTSAAASSHPAVLARTADVPAGGGKILADQKLVITQPRADSFEAFTAVCTHQGCTVGSVSDGTINCPCHGSKFSIADGSVVRGPAAAPLARASIKVQGTSIFQA
jgi:Rieske Fe-S protein